MRGSLKACVTCSKQHKATHAQCRACRFTGLPPQTCITCGESFTACDSKKCWRCRQTIVTKPCISCGVIYTGSARRCEPCRAVDRTCTTCGHQFRDRAHTECSTCRAKPHECTDCGRLIRALSRRCGVCVVKARDCTSCGKHFTGAQRLCNACRWKDSPNYEDRLKRSRAAVQRRRIMRKEQAVDGAVLTAEARARLLAGSACVYCGDPSAETDHVRPLVDGGAEHEDNIVAACVPCNRSKGPRLLTEWHRADRVAHGVNVSPIVAAEWARLTALVAH